MPANLPPQYFDAEKRYRAAKEVPEKIRAIEEMLSIMPKHKGTDKLKARLRRKIAELTESAQRKGALARFSYSVRKEGAGQLALTGLPNSGRSSLLSALTNARAEVADYPYTTRTPLPGMMPFENIQFQLIDTPSVMDESAEAWLPNILRNADALLVTVDLSEDPETQVELIREALAGWKLELSQARELTPDGWQRQRALIVGTKLDREGALEGKENLSAICQGRWPLVAVSARTGEGLEELKRLIFELLDILRVYTRTPGKKPDLASPFILSRRSTVEDLAVSVHQDFLQTLKYARVWGSGKFDGQRVKRDFLLSEGDVVELCT